MESRDLVSVSRLVLRSIFSSLGLEDFRTSLGLCLETLNIAKNWFVKIGFFQ